MSFDEKWTYPEGHPISVEEAKAHLSGELGRQHYEILARACSPIYWHLPDGSGGRTICANGTLTYVQSEGAVFGVTACHVIDQYLADAERGECLLQLGNAALNLEIIDRDDRLDLATVALDQAVLRAVGKEIAPVSLPRPGDVPQEGRGIMMCGYLGEDRHEFPGRGVGWGMLGVVGLARRVTAKQITWSPDHEGHVPVPGVPALTPHKNLGGISGGPLIAWFEKAGGWLVYYSLAGIIVEANSKLENVVALRADFIRKDGRLRK